MAPSSRGLLQRSDNFQIALGRTEAHHDVFRAKNAAQPRPEQHRHIQGRERTFADNYGMNKFHRDVLGIGGVGTATEGQKPASAQKTFGHLAAGFG